MGALSSSRSSFFFFFFLFYLPSDMKLIRIIFIFLLERGSLMSLPLVFFSFFNTLFHSLSDISFFFILLSFAFLSLEAVFIRYLSPFFISNFHSLPHVRLVFWNSIHLEVASSPFSLLVNSPWLLVFALCIFFL